VTLSLFCISLTLVAYIASLTARRRFVSVLTLPTVAATTLVAGTLFALHLDYRTYRTGVEPLAALLAPATVALALPLYRHGRTLRAHLLPAIAGIGAGVLSTTLVAIGVAYCAGLPASAIGALSVKSATAPVAIAVAGSLPNASVALAATCVFLTARIAESLGPWLLTRLGISHPVARGVALGTIGSVAGTAQAARESELAGGIGAVALCSTALAIAFAVPLIAGRMGCGTSPCAPAPPDAAEAELAAVIAGAAPEAVQQASALHRAAALPARARSSPASVSRPVPAKKSRRAAGAGRHHLQRGLADAQHRFRGEPHVGMLSLLPSAIAPHGSAILCISAAGADELYVSAVGRLPANLTTCRTVRPGKTTTYVASAVNEAGRTTRAITLKVRRVAVLANYPRAGARTNLHARNRACRRDRRRGGELLRKLAAAAANMFEPARACPAAATSILR
jgi:putative effector of murein hydrolase